MFKILLLDSVLELPLLVLLQHAFLWAMLQLFPVFIFGLDVFIKSGIDLSHHDALHVGMNLTINHAFLSFVYKHWRNVWSGQSHVLVFPSWEHF